MKYQFFIATAVIIAIGACKTPYKATDQPKTITDSTASTMDTSATMNKTPASLDSAAMSNKDSAIIDSTSRQLPDSARMSSTKDSTLVRPAKDSSTSTQQTDSTRMQPDNPTVTTAADSTQTGASAPAAVEAVFIKQYPGATNTVWSAYDSLAVVPIDMRLTGWKKMDAEDYMVKFDFKEQAYHAWYDSDGKWIGSTYTVKDLTKLPAAVHSAVQNAIKNRYKEYNVSQVNRELQPGNKSAYEVELVKDDSKIRMLVTPSGKIAEIYKYATDKTK